MNGTEAGQPKNHILLLCETGGPGGAERVVFELAKGYLTQEIGCTVATLRTGWLTQCLDEASIKRVLIKTRRGLDPLLSVRIARLARSIKATAIHSHLLDTNFYGAIAARIARLPHIATEHGDVHHPTGKKFLRTKIRIISACGSTFTAVSDYTARHLVALGAQKNRVHVVRNPVGIADEVAQMRASRPLIRRSLAIGDGDWVWLHVANLRPVKDQETLIRGFAQSLNCAERPQHLIIVGDGEERSRLASLCKELEVADSVKFVGHQKNVPAWLVSADGMIMSSQSEAMPMAIIEAASAGLVVVSSNVGGIAELLGDGRGFLFPAGNVDELSQLLNKVLNDPNAAQDSANRLHQWVTDNCTIENVVRKFVELMRLQP